MSWSDLVLPTTRRPGQNAAVSVGCTKPHGRYLQRLLVVVRSGLIQDGGLPWLVPGRWVRVQVGGGDHKGMLRLTPSAQGVGYQLCKAGGRPFAGTSMLRLGGFPGLPPNAKTGAAAEYDYGVQPTSSDWLELTLPSWLSEPAAKAVPAEKPAKAASVPYAGLGSTGHVDTFAGRRGGGPVPTGATR